MRARPNPSLIVIGAVITLLVALAAPATAAPPGNPFVGAWESIYTDDTPVGERTIWFQIGATGHISGRQDVGGICYSQFGELMPQSFLGWGMITADDPYTFEGTVDIYCHTDNGRQLGFEGWPIAFEHDAATGTLIGAGGFCVWRRGSDPASVCP